MREFGNLTYVPSVRDTPWTRWKIATAEQPLEHVLWPKSVADLLTSWQSLYAGRESETDALANKAHMSSERFREILSNGDCTINEAADLSEAFGYTLAKIPEGLRWK